MNKQTIIYIANHCLSIRQTLKIQQIQQVSSHLDEQQELGINDCASKVNRSSFRNFQKHRKKIAEIMGTNLMKTSRGTFDNKRIRVINTFYINHEKSLRYNSKSKQKAVQKENDLILKKIISVNNRRSNTLNNRSQVISHNSMTNLKKVMQNINSQNQKIANKLVTTSSNLKQQKQFESFQKHLQRKERLKKYEFNTQIGMIMPKKIKSLQKLISPAESQLKKSSFRNKISSQNQQQQS